MDRSWANPRRVYGSACGVRPKVVVVVLGVPEIVVVVVVEVVVVVAW